MSIEFLDYLKHKRDIHIKPSLAVEKRASVLTKQLCDIFFFNLISYTSWLSVRGKKSCKLHKMCFRRFVGTSTSRVFKIQNGCHVNKGKMRFYSPCGSCFIVKPSVCILPLVCSLQSAFYPWSAFYPRSAVCSPQSAFYTDRRLILNKKKLYWHLGFSSYFHLYLVCYEIILSIMCRCSMKITQPLFC